MVARLLAEGALKEGPVLGCGAAKLRGASAPRPESMYHERADGAAGVGTERGADSKFRLGTVRISGAGVLRLLGIDSLRGGVGDVLDGAGNAGVLRVAGGSTLRVAGAKVRGAV